MDITGKNKTSEWLLVLMVFVLSTRASGLANSNLLLFSVLLYNIYLALYRQIRFDRSFLFFVFFFILITFQNYTHLGPYFDPLRYLKLFSIIIISYLTIKIVKFRIFVHYNNIIYKVVLFSLPFYVWQLLSSGSLYAVGKALNGALPGLMDTVDYLDTNTSLNILVYTIEFVENFRNSGVMWEPGGFATVIAIALYFEFLLYDYKFTKRSWVYLLGIITTFSTTGYLITCLLLFFFLFKMAKKSSSRFLKPILYFSVPVFLTVLVILFFQMPIFYEKILYQFNEQQQLVENVREFDSFQSLGRFGSLQVDLASIQDQPFFGRGYTDEDFMSAYEVINFTNGLGTFIGRMGIIGFVWLVFSLYRSGKIINAGVNFSGSNFNLLPILVLLIAFSNPVLFTPLFILLQLFFIPFKNTKQYYEPVYSDSSTQP